MPLRLGNTTLSNPFLQGFGMTLLGSAGQPSQGINPFGLALQQGLAMQQAEEERRQQEELRQQALARQAMLDQLTQQRFGLEEQSFGLERQRVEAALAAQAQAAAQEAQISGIRDDFLASLIDASGSRGPVAPWQQEELLPKAQAFAAASGSLDPLKILGGLPMNPEEQARLDLARQDMDLRSGGLDVQRTNARTQRMLAEAQLKTAGLPKPATPRESTRAELAKAFAETYRKLAGEYPTPEQDAAARKTATELVYGGLPTADTGGDLTGTDTGTDIATDPPRTIKDLEDRLRAAGARPEIISLAIENAKAGKSITAIWNKFLSLQS